VAILEKAISRANDNISSLLKDSDSITAKSLRQIMQGHQNLHEICSILNEAYGFPTLLILVSVFTEAIYNLAYYYNRPDVGDGFYAFLWGWWQWIPSTIALYMCQKAENQVRDRYFTNINT